MTRRSILCSAANTHQDSDEEMINIKLLGRRRHLRTLSLISMSVLIPFLLWWRSDTEWSPLSNPTSTLQYSNDLPACLAIITGNIEGKKGDLERLLNSRKRRAALSEDFYLNETADCGSYLARRGFFTEPLSAGERDFPIAYSIVIYDKVEMFERLLRAIYNPQNVYCVHVDLKSAGTFLRAVEAIISCLPNVFLASKLERVVYASWSRVQADLNCMKDLLASHVQWKYLINTCGMDFPIKTNREMVQALKVLNGRNSMESEVTNSYKKLRWMYRHIVTDTVTRTEHAKSPPPIKSPMFAGSAYFVVTRSFVRHVLQDSEVEAFLEWERDTYSPDEHLWATLQRMPSVPGSSPANEKYDESDMNALARAVKWSYLEGAIGEGAPYEPCTGAYRRAVCVYGAGDLPWLLQRQQLFANKFDPEVDDVVIRCLESVLYFKALGQDLPLTERYL